MAEYNWTYYDILPKGPLLSFGITALCKCHVSPFARVPPYQTSNETTVVSEGVQHNMKINNGQTQGTNYLHKLGIAP